MNGSEPKIVIFCCNWGAYAGADLSETLNKPNSRIIRTMCSGRVEPSYIFQAFAQGADGVMIAGCHPGDCHYQSGNYKARRRLLLLKNTLSQFGIEPERLRPEWISASELPKFYSAVDDFIKEVTRLGPLTLSEPEKVASY